MSIQSVNPATGDVVETYEETSPKEIERILAGAQAAFAEWRNTPFTARARSMRNAAEMLKKRRTDFARPMTLEMGKPNVQAEGRSEKHTAELQSRLHLRSRLLPSKKNN